MLSMPAPSLVRELLAHVEHAGVVLVRDLLAHVEHAGVVLVRELLARVEHAGVQALTANSLDFPKVTAAIVSPGTQQSPHEHVGLKIEAGYPGHRGTSHKTTAAAGIERAESPAASCGRTQAFRKA